MEKQLQELFTLFGMLFKTHIQTKTTSPLFHKDSAAFYEFAFDAFHKIYERAIDLWLLPNMECDEAKSKTMTNLVGVQKIINGLIPQAKTKGFENLLIGLADSLEWHIGNMKAFMYEKEEAEEPETPETKGMPIKK